MEHLERTHDGEEPRSASRREREAAGDGGASGGSLNGPSERAPNGASGRAPDAASEEREGSSAELADSSDATEEWKRLYGLIRAYTEKMRE